MKKGEQGKSHGERQKVICSDALVWPIPIIINVIKPFEKLREKSLERYIFYGNLAIRAKCLHINFLYVNKFFCWLLIYYVKWPAITLD